METLVQDEMTMGIHLRDLDKVNPAPWEFRHDAVPTTTAMAATLFAQMTPHLQQQEHILSSEPATAVDFMPPFQIHLPMNLHPALGILLADSSVQEETIISGFQEGTAASHLPRWRFQI